MCIVCIMLRKCHRTTCSVGIATQAAVLRKKFAGQPEHVVNYFFFVAEQLREIMAKLGFRTLNSMVGRMDMLEPRKAVEHWKAKGLDMTPLLHMPDVPESVGKYCQVSQDHGLDQALDHKLIELARDALDGLGPVEIQLPIRNGNRTVCMLVVFQQCGHHSRNRKRTSIECVQDLQFRSIRRSVADLHSSGLECLEV